eukprot:135590-Prymnesium_polylepis.1
MHRSAGARGEDGHMLQQICLPAPLVEIGICRRAVSRILPTCQSGQGAARGEAPEALATSHPTRPGAGQADAGAGQQP